MKYSIKKIVLTGLSVAFISVMSQICIPMPSLVPITLQTLAISFCGYMFSIKISLCCIAVYILTGLIGIPVFASFQSGPKTLFGLTGGFIFGFLFLAAFCSLKNLNNKKSAQNKKSLLTSKKAIHLCAGIFGLILCHFTGVLQFSLLSKNSFFSSFAIASLPYLIKDTASVICAYALSVAVKKRIKFLNNLL